MQIFDLPNQEIFSAGTWNGDTYESKDLDRMVEAYQATAESYKPKIKLSHDHPKGWPSVGWIENVRRVGEKLFADFRGIPKTIYDMIQAKGYSGKSAEILWNPVMGGQKFPYFLKAVALLGVDMPGVDNLSDLMANLYSSDGGEARAYQSQAPEGEIKTYDLENQKEDADMDKVEQLQKDLAEANAKLADVSGQVASYAKENGELKKASEDATARAESAEGKLKEYSDAEVTRKVQSTVEKLIADKKLAPANKEKAYALIRAVVDSGVEKKYKFGEKEATLEEIAVDLLGAGEVNLSTEQKTYAGNRNGATDEKDGIINEDLAEKATAYAKLHGVPYKEALGKVAHEKAQ